MAMDHPAVKTLSLAALAGGAVEEVWQAALARVLENIEDPNTDHRVKRGISLHFAFGADEDRHLGSVVVTASTKLAGVKGLKVPVYFGRHEGHLTAVEAPRQDELFPSPHGRPRPVEAAGGAA